MDLTCLEYGFQKIETEFQRYELDLFSALWRKQTRTGECNSGYKVTLDSIGAEYHPDVAGEYVEVCSVDGKPIFM